jgi:hypothetical protein
MATGNMDEQLSALMHGLALYYFGDTYMACLPDSKIKELGWEAIMKQADQAVISRLRSRWDLN